MTMLRLFSLPTMAQTWLLGHRVRFNMYRSTITAINRSIDGKLRGFKGFGFFGGVQTPTLIKSPGLEAGGHFTGLFHITDWFSTLLNLASINRTTDDSFDQFDSLKFGGQGIRREVMIHYDPFSYEDLALAPYPTAPYGSIQVDQWSLVGGMPFSPKFPPMWYSFIDDENEGTVNQNTVKRLPTK